MSAAVQDNKEATENAEVKNLKSIKSQQSASESSTAHKKSAVKKDLGTLYYDCKNNYSTYKFVQG